MEMEYIPSTLLEPLRRKYVLRHFVSLTRDGVEALWFLGAFVLLAMSVAYFGSHFMFYIANNSCGLK